MNFLETTSSKKLFHNLNKTSPNIRLVINSFTGNEKEYEHSEELKRILKSKNYKISELIDINQELIFEREKKIATNIREHFHKKKLLFRINSKFSLPQIKIGDDLIMSYSEFIILMESGILDKIMNGSMCTHVRIFKNEIVYMNEVADEFAYCIYCYSNKKKRQIITLIANLRDYTDEENNDILSFCEGNNLTISPIDNENCFLGVNENAVIRDLIEKKEKVFIVDDEVYSLAQFYDIYEKRIKRTILNFTCATCEKKVNVHIDLHRCVKCLSSDIKGENLHNQDNRKKKIQINPYNFVQKLKLKNFANNNSNEIPARFSELNISFRK